MRYDLLHRLLDRPLDCLCEEEAGARPIHAVGEAGLADWLGRLVPAQAAFLRESGFDGGFGQVALLPGADGVEAAVLGLGAAQAGMAGPHVFGALPGRLPVGATWRLADEVGTLRTRCSATAWARIVSTDCVAIGAGRWRVSWFRGVTGLRPPCLRRGRPGWFATWSTCPRTCLDRSSSPRRLESHCLDHDSKHR